MVLLDHINSYVHPQAVIVDASAVENDYFLKAIRMQARGMGVSVIDLPQGSQKHLNYLTKLDSSSLSGKATLLCLTHRWNLD
jgi:hypothetical protein